jgi:dihydrofolate synthase / folylpolyglutamate synthase
MTYDQTIDYLFTRLPMFSRLGAAAYKDDLTNIIRLCDYLGNPQQKFKSIHVAGTNGKGSVSHMLAAVLQAAGYKTALHTSPHLKDFRERIKVNGEMIPKEYVVSFTEKIKPVIDEIDPSFFEISVAMTFDYFANEQPDFAIIETGLGGRLDSTNILLPELSIITNIGWDHMNLLGDSLEKIAAEKAGIIKNNTPVIIGEVIPETKDIFINTALKKSAPLTIASSRWQATDWKWKDHELHVEAAEEHRTDRQVYKLDLQGIYQTKNLLTVLEACSVLKNKGWNIPDDSIHTALRQVKKTTGLHGRWELIHQHPSVIVDVAHNEAGVKQLTEQVELTDHHALHIVLGMVKDKDIEKVLQLLPRHAQYYFTQASIPRALEAEELQRQAATAGLKGKAYPDVNTALKQALAVAKKEDLILVCGSVFLVAEVAL